MENSVKQHKMEAVLSYFCFADQTDHNAWLASGDFADVTVVE